MLQHRLKLNDSKTEVMVLGSTHQLKKLKFTDFAIGNATVNLVDKVYTLGIIFDKTLSMKDNVNSICSKGFYQLYRLRQIEKYMDTKSITTLVHAFVTSYLDCGNAMLFNLPENQISKLERPQKVAAKLCGKGKSDSGTECL